MADLDDIVRQYGPVVSSVCRKMIRDPFLAEDAAQNIWIIIMEKISQFRGESQLSTWIYTIAAREALHTARNEKQTDYETLIEAYHTGHLSVPSGAVISEKEWVGEHCDACLTGVVVSLDPEERLAFLLRCLAGLSHRELAVIFARSESAVRQYVGRARKKFMRFIKEECAFFTPGSVCRCGLADPVKRSGLTEEFFHIRKITETMSFLKQWDMVFPPKNWWLKKNE